MKARNLRSQSSDLLLNVGKKESAQIGLFHKTTAALMERDIAQIPMPASVRRKLYRIGFHKVDSFQPAHTEILSRELGISDEEAKILVEKIQRYSWSASLNFTRPITAFELLRREQIARHISTGSAKIDCILGGGIALGRITEFSGVPGVGKTQLCMQMCVNTQIPTSLQGLDGEAIFIDTEGGFYLERIKEIAAAMVEHCKEISDDELVLDVDTVLKRVYYIRCHDYAELIATVQLISGMLNQDELKIKLIAIDSIAASFRYAFEDVARRSKILNSLMQTLVNIAVEKNIAVVMTNQMTTRINPGEESQLVPALGTSWGHACGTRVNLFWKNDCRMAFLYKSPSHPENMAPYTVTHVGIRDLSDNQLTQLSQRQSQRQDASSLDIEPDSDTTMIFMSSQFAMAETEPDSGEPEIPELDISGRIDLD